MGAFFFNVPYDSQYEKLYVALVSGLVTLGYVPHCTLEVPATKDRLHRIFELMESCELSIHDLSRVELSSKPMQCPRFNMPFETGLAYALWIQTTSHVCAVFESEPFRLQKSLSDLNGFDPYIHGNTVDGVLLALIDLFRMADIDVLQSTYIEVSREARDIKARNGGTLFRSNSFRQLVGVSNLVAKRLGYIP